MNIHEITLDVSKEPAHEPTLYIAQGDKNGTTLVAHMFDNGQVLTLTGKTVAFCMRTPDGLDYYQVAGTVSGNVATFLIDETYAAGHPGITNIAYVVVADGDTEITSSSRIQVVVLPSAKDGVAPAPAYVSLIEAFLAEAQAEVDEAVAAAEAIVDYSVPVMSETRRGGAKLGSNLQINNEVLSVDTTDFVMQIEKGASNGIATLNSSGQVPSSELPSYVDDVIEGYYYNGAFYSDSAHTTLITGETGKIYVDLSSDTSYRWSGSAYISISNPIDVATEQEALAGSDNTKMMTPLRVHQVVSGDIEPNSVTAAGEVTATETVDGSTVLHELTDKLDEEDYLSGLTWGQIKAKYTWGDLNGNASSDMHTPNLNLSKPARLSPTAMNGNMDILDEKIGAVGSTDLQSQVNAITDSIFCSQLVKKVEFYTWYKSGLCIRAYFEDDDSVVVQVLDNEINLVYIDENETSTLIKRWQ